MSPIEAPAADRSDLAKKLFERPGIYLRNDAHIDIRKRAARELLGRVTGHLVDVGCGDGRVSLQFAADGARLTLVDPAGAMLDLAKARVPPSTDVTFVQATLDDLRLSDRVDVALLIGVLAHVPSVPVALKQLAALLRPGGVALIQITDHEEGSAQIARAVYRAKKRIWDRSGYQVHQTRGSEVIKQAHEAGFRPEAVRQYWVLPPGTGRLPKTWGLRLLEALYASDAASAWGMEKIYLLRKV